jgi:hypothetical protein
LLLIHHSVGDGIEVVLAWPAEKALGLEWRALHPSVFVPEGSSNQDRERIICRPDGPIFYRIESRVVASDGRELTRDTYDAAKAQANAERSAATNALGVGYGSDPRSMACMAAARKCRGETLSWPPPPNETLLGDPNRRSKTLAYNEQFIPHCRLQ